MNKVQRINSLEKTLIYVPENILKIADAKRALVILLKCMQKFLNHLILMQLHFHIWVKIHRFHI